MSIAQRAPAPVAPQAEALPKKRRRPSGEPPPLPRQLNASGKWWLGLLGLLVLGWLLLFSISGFGASSTRGELSILRALEKIRSPLGVDAAKVVMALGSAWVTGILRWAVVLVLLWQKRMRHLFVILGLLLVGGFITTTMSFLIARPRPLGVEILGHWQGAAQPSRPIAALAATLIGIAYTVIVPGKPRDIAKWATGVIVVAVCFARLYLGVDHPSDVLSGLILGIAIPLIAFRLFTPNEVFPVTYRRGRSAHLDVEGPRGEAIRTAVEQQLGVTLVDVEPFGLAGSAGSTPLKLTLAGEPAQVLFAKLYAKNHLRADRWYKLGRTLMYGRLEDESSFNTVRRLVQYEDYMLHVMKDGGLSTPHPYGFVEISPEREYLLVTDFVPGAKELLDAEITPDIIDQSLTIVRKLWDAGIAHRDIKPSNLIVANGTVHLIDVAFGEVRPSPWRQAVDLANMMLVLALRVGPEDVYRAALEYFTPDEIAEAFAATQGITIPSQSRDQMKKQRLDLVTRFRELAPPRRPISIQRWSVRRVYVTVSMLLCVFLGIMFALSNFSGAGLTGPQTGTQAAYSSVIKDPGCEFSDQMILVSQSVPTASLLPCIDTLPLGWSFQAMDVVDGRTVIFLTSDRAGFRAVDVTLTKTCSTAGATQVPTDEPGTGRYERVVLRQESYSGSRYYVFDGGCVTYHFDLTGEGRTALADEVTLAMSFLSRAEGDSFLYRKTGLHL